MKYVLFTLLLISAGAKGQNPGPRLSAMGSGGAAVSDVWSLQQNPAGIAGLKNPMIALAYEMHLLDSEVSTQNAVFVFPYRRNAFGISFERYGFNEYRRQYVGFGYAKSFGDSFTMAIGLRYNQLSILQYGSARAFTIEVGLQFKVTKEFTIASHISNPNQSKYNNLDGTILPAKLSIGGSFKLSEQLLMTADLRKLLGYPPDGTTGIEYQIIKWFSLRGGLSLNPFKQYTGFGMNYNKVQIDVAVASHPSLGYSPQVALGYEF